MILRVFAVRDVKTEVYSSPMFFVTNGVALRSFADEVQNAKSELARHAEDFSLWLIGSYDDQKGALMPLDLPVLVAEARDYLSVDEPSVSA